MFSYYGCKTRVVDHYPPPRQDLIIEPFAGSARYALKYWERDVILVDKYKLLVDVWKWLQQCSYDDIIKLPRMEFGEHVDDYKWDCKEQRDFMGFLMGWATTSPRRTATVKLKQRPNFVNYSLKRIASQIEHIKHWDIRCGEYQDIEDVEATWYIDPPYSLRGGDKYVHGNNKIDFNELGEWCQSRKGFVMVCESSNATWLPFKPLKETKTTKGKMVEGIWTNEPTAFDLEQLKLKI